MRKLKLVHLLALLLLSGLILAKIPDVGYADSVTVQVDPPSTAVLVNDTFAVNVTVTDVVNLTAWQFHMYYLKALLNCTGVVEGPFLASGEGNTFFYRTIERDYNLTHGRVIAAASILGDYWVNGSGTLGIVTFEARAIGDALLKLSQTKLLDNKLPPYTEPIAHTAFDGTVHITSLDVHDVAVISVSTSKSGCLPVPTVGQGSNVAIEVTVENQGGLAETFNVTVEASRVYSIVTMQLFGSAILGWGLTPGTMTIPGPTITVNQGDILSLTLTSQDGTLHNFFVDYNGDTVPNAGEPKSPDFTGTIKYKFTANTAGTFNYYCQYHKVTMRGTFVVDPPASTTTQIGKQTTTLNGGSSSTLTFDWDTTAFQKGNYTITATADIVPGETDTADNTMDDGSILITIKGDVDGDLDVDIFDIVRMAGVYGVKKSDPRYDPNCDLDGDGDIDIFDIVAAAGNYGEKV